MRRERALRKNSLDFRFRRRSTRRSLKRGNRPKRGRTGALDSSGISEKRDVKNSAVGLRRESLRLAPFAEYAGVLSFAETEFKAQDEPANILCRRRFSVHAPSCVQRRTPKTLKSTFRIGRRNAENASESVAEITNFLCLLSLAERTGVKKTLDERRRNFERIRNLAICAISSINAVCLR